MQACYVTKTQDRSFSYGTAVTSLVTASLQFSCKYNQRLIVASETLPAVKQNWMLFGLFRTRKCWALPIVLGVSHFSTPSNS